MFEKALNKVANFCLTVFNWLPRWLCDSLIALTGLHRGSQKKSPEEVKLIKDCIAEEVAYTKVFCSSLMSDLPEHLKNFEKYFDSIPRIKKKIQKYVYCEDEKEIWETGNPYSDQLILFGLKPVHDLVSIIFGLDSFLKRVLSRKGEDLLVNVKNNCFQNSELQKSALFEVSGFTNEGDWLEYREDRKRARLVLKWILEVLKYKPLLFESFKAVSEEGNLRLVSDESSDMHPISIEELNDRWKFLKSGWDEPLDLSIGYE